MLLLTVEDGSLLEYLIFSLEPVARDNDAGHSIHTFTLTLFKNEASLQL